MENAGDAGIHAVRGSFLSELWNKHGRILLNEFFKKMRQLS